MAKNTLFLLADEAAVDQFFTKRAGISLADPSNLRSEEADENGEEPVVRFIPGAGDGDGEK